MLYIFAGFPTKNQGASGNEHLHGGGLQRCIETVEELAILEHDATIQYRREGVFINETTEFLYPVEFRLSDLCLQTGITWDWFNKEWKFGNGVTVHMTLASLDYRTVIHGTNMTLDEFKKLNRGRPYRYADLTLVDEHWRHESWQAYEARWLPGTCPQENHVVHLTWLITSHKLPEFAYERIRALIEDGAEPKDLRSYSMEPGHHFSEIRRYDGRPAHSSRGAHALSMS